MLNGHQTIRIIMRIQTYSFETDTSEIILSFVTFQRTTIALFDNKILQVRLKIN